jgi:hypothetical protein
MEMSMVMPLIRGHFKGSGAIRFSVLSSDRPLPAALTSGNLIIHILVVGLRKWRIGFAESG